MGRHKKEGEEGVANVTQEELDGLLDGEEAINIEDGGEEDTEYSEPDFDGEYSLDSQAEDIAKRLKAESEYESEIGHVELDQVAFVRKWCKATKSAKKKFACCKAIKQPDKAFSSKSWIIITWGENYSMLPLSIKQRVILHEMKHIPRTCEEGVAKHDVEDFAYCVDNWGSNWVYKYDLPLLFEMEDKSEEVVAPEGFEASE